jgi:hypothetical protein
MNAISTQTRSSTLIIEKAIGDLWNQSGDSSTNNLPLQIPNLARFIGANSYLNPALIPTTSEFLYKEYLGSRYQGKNTGYLKFPSEQGSVDETVAGDHFDATGDTSGNFLTPVDFEYQVTTSGEYWIEAGTGKFRTFEPIDSTLKLEYITDPALSWVTGQETLPGVIPDPGQTNFTACRLEKVTSPSTKFYLWLPPRMPITFSDRENPAAYPESNEWADNRASTQGVTPKKYWQEYVSSATLAFTGSGDYHYRYSLPKEIIDMGLVEGDEIPRGMMLLWDAATNSIIDDVVFKWPDSTRELFAVQVESAAFNLDNASKLGTTHSEADYNKSDFYLITCGTSLTRALWTLGSAFFRHNHSNDGTLEGTIEHRDLKDLNPPSSAALMTGDDYAGHNSRYPTYLPSRPPSGWAHYEHTSLLSSVGSCTTRASYK